MIQWLHGGEPDLLTRVARIFNWAQLNPDQYAKAKALITGQWDAVVGADVK